MGGPPVPRGPPSFKPRHPPLCPMPHQPQLVPKGLSAPDSRRDQSRRSTKHSPSSLRIACPSHLSGRALAATSGYVSPEAERETKRGRERQERQRGRTWGGLDKGSGLGSGWSVVV